MLLSFSSNSQLVYTNLGVNINALHGLSQTMSVISVRLRVVVL
ncbi:hypothetical protein VCRA2119O381_800028 [Vibrio crassostreae]|nr:hypothetical protein VCRA2119O381_800028 [Vibrio crassostreae]